MNILDKRIRLSRIWLIFDYYSLRDSNPLAMTSLNVYKVNL